MVMIQITFYIILISQAGKYPIEIPIKLYHSYGQAVNCLFMNSHNSKYNHDNCVVMTRK